MKNISYFLFFIFFVSCTSEIENNSSVEGAVSLEEGFTPHPELKRMPHPNAKAKELKIIADNTSLPKNLQLLYSFLNDDIHDINLRELELHVSSQHSFHAASIDEHILVILDQRRNRLIQFNLNEDTFKDLAPEGRGPGDLLFTKEMQVFDNKIYIAMQGYRISIFNCETGACEYESTIQTDFNNYSLSPTEDYVTVLGIPPFGRDQDQDPENYDLPLIYLLKKENNQLERSFSRIYQHKAPIVREQMNSGGTVRTFPKFETSVVMNNIFPYIYLYNNQGELTEKFKIPGFKVGYYDYNERELRGRFRHNDNTTISNTTKIGEEWVLLQFRNREGMEYKDREGLEGNQWYTYYAFNVKNHELHTLGEDFNERSIYTTEYGLLINEAGSSLYWLSLKN